jgi:hypothetical protein
MPTPDFIRLNGEAVRLTSLTRGPDGDEMTAVVMLRGLRDHERLVDLLGRSPVSVALPGEEARAMSIARNEFTSTGDEPSAIYRHVIVLREGAEEAPEPESMDLRLARIEGKLDRVLELLQRM